LIVGLDLDESPSPDAGGPYAAAEGGSVSVAATGSDPDGDVIAWAWDLDNDGTFETAGQSATFSAAGIDGPATRTIAVRATAGGQSVTDQSSVTVSNVDPTATFNAPASSAAGLPFTVSLTDPADPASADLAGLTYAFDCGDGAGYGSFGTATSRSCPTTDAGSRTVRGTVRDDDGGTNEYISSVEVQVTYAGLCQLGTELVSRPVYGRILCGTLRAAESAENRGRTTTKAALLRAYRLEVDAIARARGLTADEAALLKRLSTGL
jgi:PKD repeat protein